MTSCLSRGQLAIVLVTTFLAFCTLYTPQPLLPLLVSVLDVSVTEASLLVTVTLVPLGLAPIVYGYFLQAIPARLMLRLALVLLSLDQILQFFCTSYWQLLTLRLIQGIILPALFTALMTYCASMVVAQKVRLTMGLYVASTIAGGCLSRALSGLLATILDWQSIFLVLGLLLLLPLWLTTKLPTDARINFSRLDIKAVSRILGTSNFFYSYLSLFTVFFVFGGILALVPFRVDALQNGASPMLISLIYLGYVAGIPAAIFSDRAVRWTGGEKAVLFCGLGLITIGVAGYLTRSIIFSYLMMLPLAGGMFLIHATLSGYVNHIAEEHKGVVNGIYVSVYYLSGTLGSWLPVLFYQWLSWTALIALLLGIIAIGGILILRLRPATNTVVPQTD